MNDDAPMPARLVAAVLVLAATVLVLAGAVVAIQLRAKPSPKSQAEATVEGWQRAVRASPDSSIHRTGLGLALMRAGDSVEAQEAFEQAVRLDPADYNALLQLGLLLRNSDKQDAEQVLVRAADAAPRTKKVEALVALGSMQLERGDATAAKATFERAVSDAPYVIEGHFGLARALEALGDESGALEHYKRGRRFVQADPAIDEAIARLESKETG